MDKSRLSTARSCVYMGMKFLAIIMMNTVPSCCVVFTQRCVSTCTNDIVDICILLIFNDDYYYITA